MMIGVKQEEISWAAAGMGVDVGQKRGLQVESAEEMIL
jgi:hypothetical protein